MFRVCLWLQGLYPYNRPYKDGVNYLAWFAWRFEASQEGQQSGGGCLFIACSTFHPENLMVRGLQFPGMKFPGGLPLYTLLQLQKFQFVGCGVCCPIYLLFGLQTQEVMQTRGFRVEPHSFGTWFFRMLRIITISKNRKTLRQGS